MGMFDMIEFNCPRGYKADRERWAQEEVVCDN